jgi:hypothetical protein
VKNTGLMVSYAINDQRAAAAPSDDLFALRLWWSF